MSQPTTGNPYPPQSNPPPGQAHFAPGPYAPDPYGQDKSHLNLLAVFYYVAAGFSLFGALVCLAESIFGIFMIVASQQEKTRDAETLFVIGIVWVCIGGLIFFFSLMLGVLQIMTGRKLQKRTGRTFCFVTAVITALNIPLGTVLGVFTFIVLNRPSVQQMFKGTT